MTLKETKKELNALIKRLEKADYVSMAEIEHSIILAKRILAAGGKL